MINNSDFTLDKVLVIIPYNGSGENDENLLNTAVKSIPDGIDCFVVCSKSCPEPQTDAVVLVLDDTNGSFCENVNAAVKRVREAHPQYEWISILEHDDTFNADVVTKNAEKYIKEHSDKSIFLWLNYLVDFNSQQFVGFANEVVWAMAFANEFGNVETECLNDFFSFQLSGALIKADLFDSADFLRSSIKIYHWYEWLFRMVKNGVGAYVIPKVGYNHMLLREGSMFDEYQKTISEKENSYWLNVAKESSDNQNDDNNYAYAESVK